jgi:hypothetical protein
VIPFWFLFNENTTCDDCCVCIVNTIFFILGDKKVVHVVTPHPEKQTSKTPAESKPKEKALKTPADSKPKEKAPKTPADCKAKEKAAKTPADSKPKEKAPKTPADSKAKEKSPKSGSHSCKSCSKYVAYLELFIFFTICTLSEMLLAVGASHSGLSTVLEPLSLIRRPRSMKPRVQG